MSHSFEKINALASLTKDSFSTHGLDAINRLHKFQYKGQIMKSTLLMALVISVSTWAMPAAAIDGDAVIGGALGGAAGAAVGSAVGGRNGAIVGAGVGGAAGAAVATSGRKEHRYTDDDHHDHGKHKGHHKHKHKHHDHDD
jgi:hypothetical protein